MRLAIFDVDGTLVDSRAMITASLRQAFAAASLAAPPPERMLSIVGLSLLDAMKTLAPELEDQAHRHMADAYRTAFWQLRASGSHPEDLFVGARDLLDELRQSGVTLGIATGKSRRGIAHLLEAKNLEGWFATIQTADDHPSKPHPSMIAAALAETGAAAHQAIMIGDTSFDMAMAREAGTGAAGVAWGNHSRSELERAGAHSIASDFKELRMQLDSLWEQRKP